MEIVRDVLVNPLDSAAMNNLPERVKLTLRALEGERIVLVKGGTARLGLLALLKARGEFKDNVRYEIETRVNDLDICLLRTGTWEKQAGSLKEAGMALQKALAAFGVTLEPKDTEFVSASSFNADAIKKILCSRDLTINEVVLVFRDGRWNIHYTPECREDLINGVGFLNPRAGLVWYVCGKAIPSPLGIARLVKYLVNGKVNRIVFPKFFRELYFQEIARRVEGKDLPLGVYKLPEGGSLGLYSLVLMKLYCQGDKQRRAMLVLKELGLTDLDDPAAYIREQELLFQLNRDTIFELNDMDWDQVIAKQKKRNEMVNDGRKARKDARAACQHEMVPQVCPGCGHRCNIQKCTKCTQVIFRAPLPCVAALFEGRTMKFDGMEDIFYVPPLPKMMD